MTVQRPVYQKVLYDRAIELGVTVRLGCRIEEIDQSVPSLRLVGGEEFRADLIIGADGEFMPTFVFPDLMLLQVYAQEFVLLYSARKFCLNVATFAFYA